MKIERNDELTLTIDGLGSEGQGIGRHEGFAVFVPYALPGERVRARVIKPGKSFAIAKIMEILEASPARVHPACPAFGRCGGCTLMHASYEEQLKWKRLEVENALVRIGGFEDVSVRPVLGMEDPYRYRNKAAFPFGMEQSKARFGFYAPRSHRLVPLDDCPIQQKPLVECAKAVRKWANVCGVPAYDEETGQGVLRHIVARGSRAGEVMAAVVTKGPLPHREKLVFFLREGVAGLTGIVHSRNDKNTNVIFGERFETVWGEERLTETIRGLSFEVSAASFLQVNPEQTEKLYAQVEALLPENPENVVDVFSGTGTLTLLAARRAKKAVGIECVAEAVADAARNAARNNITNASFLLGDAAVELKKLVASGFKPDVVILDPPRKGCEPAVLEALIESGARRVVYVSCDPATLARDCKRLRAGGYALKSVQPVDMFPQTSHVETCVLLSHKNPQTSPPSL